jgi:hypothetical protein
MTRRPLAALAVAAVVLGSVAGCGSDAPEEVLRVDGRLDEVRLEEATASSPARLDPTATTVLVLSMANLSDEDVEVRHVRLEGELLGLTFLTYDVRVRAEVPAGEARSVEVPLEFFDLDRQAHGYLRAHVRLYDEERARLSSDEFAVDVRGRVVSTMTGFAALLLAITAGSLAFGLRDLARRRLPAHRVARGVRFLVPGLGVGLLLSAALSMLRVFPLPTSGWVPLTLVPTVAGFAAGFFLAPGPEDGAGEEGDAAIDAELDEEAAAVAEEEAADRAEDERVADLLDPTTR